MKIIGFLAVLIRNVKRCSSQWWELKSIFELIHAGKEASLSPARGSLLQKSKHVGDVYYFPFSSYHRDSVIWYWENFLALAPVEDHTPYANAKFTRTWGE